MTPAPVIAILALPHDPGSEIMRAVLFHAQSTGHQKDWNEFVHRQIPGLGPPQEARELGPGAWFLPLPACQYFLDGLTAMLRRPLPNAVATTLEVDYTTPWQTVS